MLPKPILPGDRVVQRDPRKLRLDGDTQSRVETDGGHVRELREQIRAGEELSGGLNGLEAITVFWDGKHEWVSHGHHRTLAYIAEGHRQIWVLVRNGTLRDARIHSASCNRHTYLKRSNEDKQRAVLILLQDEEWGDPARKKNTEIAAHCGVDETMVRRWRAWLEQQRREEERRRRGKQRKERDGSTDENQESDNGDDSGEEGPRDYEPTAEDLANPWLHEVLDADGRVMDAEDEDEENLRDARAMRKVLRRAAFRGMSLLNYVYRFAPRPPAEEDQVQAPAPRE